MCYIKVCSVYPGGVRRVYQTALGMGRAVTSVVLVAVLGGLAAAASGGCGCGGGVAGMCVCGFVCICVYVFVYVYIYVCICVVCVCVHHSKLVIVTDRLDRSVQSCRIPLQNCLSMIS